jgi:hypothetical protein
VHTQGLPRRFWIYLAVAALVAAGLADFPIIAYRFQQTSAVSATPHGCGLRPVRGGGHSHAQPD